MIAMNNGRQFYQELAVEIYPDGNIPGVVSHPPPTASPPPPPKKTPEKKPPPGFLGDTNGHAGAEIDLKPEQAQLPQIKFGQVRFCQAYSCHSLYAQAPFIFHLLL